MPGNAWHWWKKSGATAPTSRFIWLNSVDHVEEHATFLGNVVYTTKYNLATFLPKALFEQYRYRCSSAAVPATQLLQLAVETPPFG